jgi:hypothetical protein
MSVSHKSMENLSSLLGKFQKTSMGLYSKKHNISKNVSQTSFSSVTSNSSAANKSTTSKQSDKGFKPFKPSNILTHHDRSATTATGNSVNLSY